MHTHIEDTGGGNIFLWIIERHNIYVICTSTAGGRIVRCMAHGGIINGAVKRVNCVKTGGGRTL